MTIGENLIQSFLAFNMNAFSYFIYYLTNNLYIIILIACTIATIMLGLKDVVDVNVAEEQNIL